MVTAMPCCLNSPSWVATCSGTFSMPGTTATVSVWPDGSMEGDEVPGTWQPAATSASDSAARRMPGRRRMRLTITEPARARASCT